MGCEYERLKDVRFQLLSLHFIFPSFHIRILFFNFHRAVVGPVVIRGRFTCWCIPLACYVCGFLHIQSVRGSILLEYGGRWEYSFSAIQKTSSSSGRHKIFELLILNLNNKLFESFMGSACSRLLFVRLKMVLYNTCNTGISLHRSKWLVVNVLCGFVYVPC